MGLILLKLVFSSIPGSVDSFIFPLWDTFRLSVRHFEKFGTRSPAGPFLCYRQRHLATDLKKTNKRFFNIKNFLLFLLSICCYFSHSFLSSSPSHVPPYLPSFLFFVSVSLSKMKQRKSNNNKKTSITKPKQTKPDYTEPPRARKQVK